jgi:nucleotide-binding universal stress UspA family protein
MDDTAAPMWEVNVENVLVPLDGSDVGFRALPTALELANRFGAQLRTITVVSGEDELKRLGESIPSSLGRFLGDIGVRVEIGDEPSEAIVRRATDLGSCLICLTTRARGRISGAVLGSVARSVVQQSEGPTVVLGPLADNPGWSPPPKNWPKPLSVPRLVACVDGTKTSEQVLPLAAGWATALGMSWTILTVANDTPSMRSEDQRDPAHVIDPEGYVDSLVEQWRKASPVVDGEVVRDPISPASGIRHHLDQRPAGLLALTTHGRSGLQRMRFGARAANIVRTASVPCLVHPVPPPDGAATG